MMQASVTIKQSGNSRIVALGRFPRRCRFCFVESCCVSFKGRTAVNYCTGVSSLFALAGASHRTHVIAALYLIFFSYCCDNTALTGASHRTQVIAALYLILMRQRRLHRSLGRRLPIVVACDFSLAVNCPDYVSV